MKAQIAGVALGISIAAIGGMATSAQSFASSECLEVFAPKTLPKALSKSEAMQFESGQHETRDPGTGLANGQLVIVQLKNGQTVNGLFSSSKDGTWLVVDGDLYYGH